MRLRQVDKARGHALAAGPLQGLPLGRKLGKRIKRRLAGCVLHIDQHGHRRAQLGALQHGQQRLALGRAFDEQAIRLQLLQRLQQTTRTARAVVAYAKKMNQISGSGHGRGQSGMRW